MFFPLLVTSLVLAIVCFVFRLTLWPLMQIARMKKRLLKEGVEADAVLLHVERTGLYVNKQPQVKLQVQVHPRTGRNFVSETREVLTQIDVSSLRVGSTLKVKYNPANTKEVMLLHSQMAATF